MSADSCSPCLVRIFDAPALVRLVLVVERAHLDVVVATASDDVQHLAGRAVSHRVAVDCPLLRGTAVERLQTDTVASRL